MRTQATVLLLAAIALSACSAPPSPTPAATAPPSAPQPVEFRTASGIMVTGRFYPAAAQPAPAVVLMHGGGGGMDDWTQSGIVAWLRRDAHASSALPRLPADLDMAVFIFTFRGNWLEAGRAAVETARGLPGVDPQRLATIGGSSGADVAAAACRVPGCLGTLALSALGSFDRVLYGDTVAALSVESKIAWCLATTGDHGCPPAEGAHYREFVYPGYGHGIGMLSGGGMPGAGDATVDFLDCAFRQQC